MVQSAMTVAYRFLQNIDRHQQDSWDTTDCYQSLHPLTAAAANGI